MRPLAARPLGIAAAAGALLVGGGLGACGVSTKDADKESGARSAPGGAQAPRNLRLPARPSGLVAVAGALRGSITASVVDGFNRSTQGTRATFSATGEDAAFRDLCAGRIDVVDSVREVSAAELAACRRRGIVLAPKIQVASDAVIVATRNESDVGGDCMTVGDVNAIFRSGSVITNWSQLGFDNLPLRTTGPNATSNVFGFFAQTVFGVPAGATLGSFRNDYQPRETDDGVRFLVVNRLGLDRERRLARARVRRALRADQAARQRAVDAAEGAAERRAMRQINAINARNRRLKLQVDAPKLIASNRRLVERLKAGARARVNREYNRRALSRATAENNLALLRAERPGVVGYFRFTYYENFEDQLRPFEIDPTGLTAAQAANVQTATPAGRTTPASPSPRRPNCVFPSQTTITNQQYPLSRALLLYVGQHNLRRAEVQAFLRYYLLNGERFATQNRLVPIPDLQRDQQLAAVTGREPAGASGAATGPPSAAPGGGGVPGVASSAPGPGNR